MINCAAIPKVPGRLLLPFPTLAAGRFDLMGTEFCDRDGGELVSAGLHIDHQPWHFNVFARNVGVVLERFKARLGHFNGFWSARLRRAAASTPPHR